METYSGSSMGDTALGPTGQKYNWNGIRSSRRTPGLHGAPGAGKRSPRPLARQNTWVWGPLFNKVMDNVQDTWRCHQWSEKPGRCELFKC